MTVRTDALRMVDGVAGAVQRRAVRQVPHVVRKLLICVGISLEAVLEAAAVKFGILCHRWGRRSWCRGRSGPSGGRGPSRRWKRRRGRGLNGVVAGCQERCAVCKVASVSHVRRRGQWRAGHMWVWHHRLRMVDSVARGVHRGAVRQVADRVHKLGAGKRGSRDVLVRGNGLRMIDGIARPVHQIGRAHV